MEHRAGGDGRWPLVSVIVPVYNGGRYLRESLDSILAQTYPHVELLVMDDASTDDTREIVASYGDRLRSHRQESTRGIYGNANDGIALANGEYVAIYHGDDVYFPTIVERQVAFLERYPAAGAVFCKDVFIDPLGRERGRLELPPMVRSCRPLPYSTVFNALLSHKNQLLRCPSSMVRASVYADVGLYRDRDFKNTSDLEMWLRIARAYPIGIIDEYLYAYRSGHGSSAQRYHHLRTDPNRFFEIMDLYLREGGAALATPQALADYEAHRAEDHLMCAISHYIRGDREAAQTLLGHVQARQILAGSQIQRARLVALLLALQGVVRLPRIPALAALMYGRWHVKDPGSRHPISRLMRTLRRRPASHPGAPRRLRMPIAARSEDARRTDASARVGAAPADWLPHPSTPRHGETAAADAAPGVTRASAFAHKGHSPQ